MAFSLKSATSMKAGMAAGRVSRKNCVAVRAGKYDEELIKTAVRGCCCSAGAFAVHCGGKGPALSYPAVRSAWSCLARVPRAPCSSPHAHKPAHRGLRCELLHSPHVQSGRVG